MTHSYTHTHTRCEVCFFCFFLFFSLCVCVCMCMCVCLCARVCMYVQYICVCTEALIRRSMRIFNIISDESVMVGIQINVPPTPSDHTVLIFEMTKGQKRNVPAAVHPLFVFLSSLIYLIVNFFRLYSCVRSLMRRRILSGIASGSLRLIITES